MNNRENLPGALQGVQMAMALPPEKPLEKFGDWPRRPLAPGRKPDAARRKAGSFGSRKKQERQLPHIPPLLCYASARDWI